MLGAEVVIERPDGSHVPVLMNVEPLKDQTGRVEGAVCSFQELTERKRAEDALRASEAELQSVINRTPFMMVRCSRDLRYRFISEAYAQMIDCGRDEVIGKTIAEMLGQAGFNTLRPFIDKVLRGESVDFECELTFPGIGMRYTVTSRIGRKPMRKATSTAGLRRCSTSPNRNTPIARATAYEAELRQLSEQLEAEVERRTLERDRIWNVSEDLLAVSNFEGYFVSINPAWTRLLGWTRGRHQIHACQRVASS